MLGECASTDGTVTNLTLLCRRNPVVSSGLHEFEQQRSHVRSATLSAPDQVPRSLCEPPIYTDGHRDAHAEGDPDSEAASEPPASPDTVRQQNRRSKIS